MRRRFNVTGVCRPQLHYMVNLDKRLKKIKELIDAGEYFTINRARQYGKTTTLRALEQYLQPEYTVISMDFQMLSQSSFESEEAFVRAFAGELVILAERGNIPQTTVEELRGFVSGRTAQGDLRNLFLCLSAWCAEAEKPVVLMIDEVDNAANNQVFLDFLAQFRGYYLQRESRPAFQSVILAGVYDIKNLKQKIRTDTEHRLNSPWNIAADFNIDMSFDVSAIAGMLEEYEADYSTGMNIEAMAQLIYDYTSGYPFLVSKLCKILDEQIAQSAGEPDRSGAWTYEGFQEAMKLLLAEKNTLFESMVNKLYDYPELHDMIYNILFAGREIPYSPLDYVVETAVMFGFVANKRGIVAIANRIFETVFYNLFLTSAEVQKTDIYQAAVRDKGGNNAALYANNDF